MALVLPMVTLGVTSRAQAQVTQLPSWAVTEFKNLKKGVTDNKFGQAAADAVSSELAKTNRYDVVPQDTVKRSIETLKLQSPPESIVNLTRIGGDVRAGTILEGQVLDYKIRNVGGGKQAVAVLRMVAYDVTSGLTVNGALEKGESAVRSNASDDELITDAIGQAAAQTVSIMQRQQLPSATVLNTGTRNALLNQGTRSGFKTGDSVIITRGPIQVGTGRIGVIEPDQAEMSVERSYVGLAPGDRVRAIFSPPALPPANATVIRDDFGVNVPRSARRSGGTNNATLISALLVVGLVAVLLSSGNSNGTTATTSTTAEATVENSGAPGVLVSWSPNGFFKGTGTTGNGLSRWQIYRSGVSQQNPVLVVDGGVRSAVDSSTQDNSTQAGQLQLGQIGGVQCLATSPTNQGRTAPALLIVGTPYVYSVEAVYKVSQLDLPTPPGSTSTGSTAGTSTAGTSTAGTSSAGGTSSGTTTAGQTTAGGTSAGSTTSTAGSTSTSGSTGEASCYFQSARSFTKQATPLNRPVIGAIGAIDSSTPIQTFSFTSNQGFGSTSLQYVIEFSNDPSFPLKYTVRTEPFNTTTQQINTGGSLFNKKGVGNVSLLTAARIYYRVGVRNSTDSPGPRRDGASGQRYIYSFPTTTTFFDRTQTTFPTS